MDRETKDITAGSHTFKVKTYATAREGNAIQQAYFSGTKVNIVEQKPSFSDINPNVLFDVQQETIRQMVVSMDDIAENVLDRCLDLPNDEFDDLAAQLDAIVSKKKK